MIILGGHFLEQESSHLVDTVKRIVRERGTTYVVLGTPDERRRIEILRGSLVSALVRDLPGIDIRIVANGRSGGGAVIVMTAALAVLLAAIALAIFLAVRRGRRRRGFDGSRRILVPFTGGALDGRVLAAAIRVSQAERATLVPAYLLVVPLRLPPDAPMEAEVARAMPLLEAVEYAALRAGVPVDARIEKGRTPTHALQQIWGKTFSRIIAPAPTGAARFPRRT